MTRWSGALVLLIAAGQVAGAALASPAPPRVVVDVDGTRPTVDDVTGAAARTRAAHCPTPSCRAIEAVAQLIQIVGFEYDHEQMGTARIMYSEKLVWRWRRRVLLDRRALYPAFCAAGARLLSRLPDAAQPGFEVATELLVAAVDIDLRRPSHCVRAMVAAMPRSSAANDDRRFAHSECEDDWHSRPKTACNTLLDSPPAVETKPE